MSTASGLSRNGSRRHSTALSVTVLVVIILASLTSYVRRVDALCAQEHWGECTYNWGYTDRDNLGWLVPANTTVYTPLQTNITITNWMEGEIVVFPFHVEPLTSAIVGVYVNGELEWTVSYGNLSQNSVGGYGGSCNAGKCGSLMLESISPDLAIFSDWTWELSLYHSFPSQSIASGSTMALAFEASKPLWVSVDNQSSGFTYEDTRLSFTSLPATFPQNSPQAPYTVAAWVYSPNPHAPGGPVALLWPLQWFVALCFITFLIAIALLVWVRRVRARRAAPNEYPPLRHCLDLRTQRVEVEP
jgi:hypothetical protein